MTCSPDAKLISAAWTGVRFDDEEYNARRGALGDALAEHGLDVAVLADERVVWHLTGFGSTDTMGSRARPVICVLGADHAACVLAHESMTVTVSEMIGMGIEVRPYERLGTPVAEIARTLAAARADGVGAELGGQLSPRLDLGGFMELQARLGHRLQDVSAAVWSVRMCKSASELARIRRACEMTDAAYNEGFARIREGDTERDIASWMATALLSQGAHGAWSTCVTGRGDYGRVDGVPRARPTMRGDLVFVDMGANVGGYWADFSRAGVVGGATDHHHAMQARIHRATDAGVEALVPGRRVDEVAQVLDSAMAAEGLDFNTRPGRYGHGLGMLVTEPPDIARHDETVLRAGMVVTIEPGHYDDVGYYHCEENVLLTDHGPEVLSRSDWRLRDLG